MHKPIDATKFDVRGLWTGLKEEHTSPDAGMVEGYPFDPPNQEKGWLLVSVTPFPAMKTEPTSYFTLWIRPKKGAPKKKRKPRTAPSAGEAPAGQKETTAAPEPKPLVKAPARPKKTRQKKKTASKPRSSTKKNASTSRPVAPPVFPSTPASPPEAPAASPEP